MLDAKENPHRDPDTAMVMLTMASGALVHVNSSFRAVYGYDQRIEAFGEKGMLISRNHQPTTLERHDAGGIRQDPLLRFFIERYAESYARELDEFVRAIDEKRARHRPRRWPAGADDRRGRRRFGEVRGTGRARHPREPLHKYSRLRCFARCGWMRDGRRRS